MQLGRTDDGLISDDDETVLNAEPTVALATQDWLLHIRPKYRMLI